MKRKLCFLLLVFCLVFAGCQSENTEKSEAVTEENLMAVDQEDVNKEIGYIEETPTSLETETKDSELTLNDIPEYSGFPYVEINDNEPFFAEDDMTTNAFENYSVLDALGRCGTAYANVGQELMPTEERGFIGSIKPSGWHTVKYDCVDGKYLYNRCHLIGYQLSAENANDKNLITGTRYLNVDGMLPFENMVADYVKETANHVLYRITPLFDGDNLVASGVLMEAKSVEDKGDGICFNVYCYNVQPGVTIDYATGESSESIEISAATEEPVISGSDQPSDSTIKERNFILNTNTKKFHLPTCKSVHDMKDKNKEEYTGSREELINQGYDPCGNCNP